MQDTVSGTYLAAKGPVSAIMFPVERASPSNIDSWERFYDSLFAPTTNQIRPRGSLNDSLWLNIFNHKMAPSTCQALAMHVLCEICLLARPTIP